MLDEEGEVSLWYLTCSYVRLQARYACQNHFILSWVQNDTIQFISHNDPLKYK